jgi:tetratricopeptide (TPR) repeat protein
LLRLAKLEGTKTVCALFQERFADSSRLFERFFWIDATDVVTANQGFEEVAKEAFPDREPGAISVQAVLNWMGALDEEWLLILDNATNKTAEKVIPPGNRGNILLTSRDQEIGLTLPPAAVAEVNDMEREDAITLLVKTAGHAVAYNPVIRDEAASVVDQLGCLALAVDQAGAYIRNLRLSIREYGRLLTSKKTDMFRDPRFKGAVRRNQAVYATFDISLKAITDYVKEYQGYVKGEDARNALKILRLICFYHNEAVMLEMFRRAAETRKRTPRDDMHFMGPGAESPQNLVELRDGVWDSEPLQYGLRILENFSLIKSDPAGQTVSMHVLVQAWARDSIEEEDRARHASRARIILFDSIPGKNELKDYRFRLRLSSHITAFLENTDIRLNDANIESFYDCKLGLVYNQMGKWDEAEAAFKAALNYRRGVAEFDDDWVLDVLRSLGHLYREAHRPADVEAVELEVVEARRNRIRKIEEYIAWETSLIESNAVETIATTRKRSEFGFLQSMHPVPGSAQQPDHARQESLNFARKQLKRNYISLSTAMYGLMMNHVVQSDWDLAERACIETMEVKRTWDPAGFQRCESVMQRIADLRAGRVERVLSVHGAEAALKNALAQYGENHADTLKALKNLIEAEIASDSAQNAEPHAVDYIMRCCEVFGEYHADSLEALTLHAALLEKLGDQIAAEEKYRECLRRAQRGLGIYHPTTVMLLIRIAGPILEQGRPDEAKLIILKAQELLTAVHGANHGLVTGLAPGVGFMLTRIQRFTTELAIGMADEVWKKRNARRQRDVPIADRDLLRWIKYNHLSEHWGDGTRPEEAYFTDRPPHITALFQDWELEEPSAQPESSTARDPDLAEEFL